MYTLRTIKFGFPTQRTILIFIRIYIQQGMGRLWPQGPYVARSDFFLLEKMNVMILRFFLGNLSLECAESNGPLQLWLFGPSAGNPKEMLITNRKPFILPTGSATLKASGVARHCQPRPHRKSLVFAVSFPPFIHPSAHTPQTGNELTHSGGKRNWTRRMGLSRVKSCLHKIQ